VGPQRRRATTPRPCINTPYHKHSNRARIFQGVPRKLHTLAFLQTALTHTHMHTHTHTHAHTGYSPNFTHTHTSTHTHVLTCTHTSLHLWARSLALAVHLGHSTCSRTFWSKAKRLWCSGNNPSAPRASRSRSTAQLATLSASWPDMSRSPKLVASTCIWCSMRRRWRRRSAWAHRAQSRAGGEGLKARACALKTSAPMWRACMGVCSSGLATRVLCNEGALQWGASQCRCWVCVDRAHRRLSPGTQRSRRASGVPQGGRTKGKAAHGAGLQPLHRGHEPLHWEDPPLCLIL